MLKQVPVRRGGGASATIPTKKEETYRLQLTKEEFQAAKAFLTGLYKELSVAPKSADGQEGEITLLLDPRAMALVPIYIRALRKTKEVETAAEVKADDLEALQERALALGVFLRALQKLRGDLVFSRLVVASAQGVMWDEQIVKLNENLRATNKTEGERELLRASAKEVLDQVEKEQGQKADRLEHLKKARVSAQARMAQASKQRRLMQALLALQDDDDISPELRDELISIYEETVRVPEEDARFAPR